MKKLLVLFPIMLLLLSACDLINTGIPEFINQYGTRSIATPVIHYTGEETAFDFSESINLTSDTESVKFYYTTDGSVPTTSSSNAQKLILPTDAQTYTLRVIAVKMGYTNSEEASTKFTQAKVAKPSMVYDGDEEAFDFTKTIKFESDTLGVRFYYTTDNSEPTASSPLSGTNLTLPTDTTMYTVKVIAVKAGYIDSEVHSIDFTEQGTVVKPEITILEGQDEANFDFSETITFTSTTEDGANGVSFYYTIDNNAPTASSTLTGKTFTLPLNKLDTYTVKVIAVKAGYNNSVVAERTFTKGKVAKPSITIPSGQDADNFDFNETITFTSTTGTTADGVFFRYTTDGITTPSSSSPSDEKITLPSSANEYTVKVIATKAGLADSEVATKTFTKETMVMKPTMHYTGDNTDFNFNETITFKSDTVGAIFYYTTDGMTDPTTSSLKETSINLKKLGVASPATVKVIAVKEGLTDSEVATKIFTKGTVAKPSMTYTGDNTDFNFNETITFTSTTVGAIFYYTTDGNEPTTSSDSATSINFKKLGVTSPATVKVLAVKMGLTNSDVVSIQFTQGKVATPNITHPGVNTSFDFSQDITFTSTTPGVSFRYTIDNNAPTATSPLTATTFKLPLDALDTYTVKVIATKEGFADSEVTTKAFTKGKVAKPSMTHSGSNTSFDFSQDITFKSDTLGVTFHYTTDGNEPTTSSDSATSINLKDLGVTSPVTVKVLAVKTGLINSEIVEKIFTQRKLATPNINSNGFIFDDEIYISITSTDSARIYYTLDNTDPTDMSTPSSGVPIKFTATTTLKAIAIKDNYTNSDIATAKFSKAIIPTSLVEKGAFDITNPTGVTTSVTLSRDFYMGKTEVTQGQWEEVMGSGRWPTEGYTEEKVLPMEATGKGNNYPVYSVNWYNAVAFCNALSTKENLPSYYTITTPNSGAAPTVEIANADGKGYRLPTEAEWEYAAGGGTHLSPFKYPGSNTLHDVAHYSANSGTKTNPVKGKTANALDLYDMSGNVQEWCWDIPNMYPSSAKDPMGNGSAGNNHAIRGGSYSTGTDSNALTVTGRTNATSAPNTATTTDGLRVVRNK